MKENLLEIRKIYLEPGSINCMCCPDIPSCRNLQGVLEECDDVHKPHILYACVAVLFLLDLFMTANIYSLHNKIDRLQKNFDGAIAAMVRE